MKKDIYNNIMKNVSKVVKKRLNEDYDEFEKFDEDNIYSDDDYSFEEDEEPEGGFVSYFDIMEELERYGYEEGDTIPAIDLYKAVHTVHFPCWSRNDDEAEFCEEFNVTIDWSDDNDDTLTESVDDIYGDDDTFMFDDDKEDEFYDSDGNWDPIEDDEEEFDLNTTEGHICDVVGGMQYVDFTRTSPVHLIDADIDIEQIDSDNDYSVTLTDTDGDTYELSDFTESDLQILSDAIDDYVTEVGDDY